MVRICPLTLYRLHPPQGGCGQGSHPATGVQRWSLAQEGPWTGQSEQVPHAIHTHRHMQVYTCSHMHTKVHPCTCTHTGIGSPYSARVSSSVDTRRWRLVAKDPRLRKNKGESGERVGMFPDSPLLPTSGREGRTQRARRNQPYPQGQHGQLCLPPWGASLQGGVHIAGQASHSRCSAAALHPTAEWSVARGTPQAQRAAVIPEPQGQCR